MRDRPTPVALPTSAQVAAPAIEPGLLPIFRLIVALQIGQSLISLALATLGTSAYDGQPVALTWQVLLLGYLTWSTLPRTLGRAYLPIALAFGSVIPILERVLFLYFQPQRAVLQFIPADIVLLYWRLFVMLLAPLVLIAWQYSLRWVVFFSIGTTALIQALAFWCFGSISFAHPDLAGLSVTSAVMFMVVGYIVVSLMRAQRQQRQALEAANRRLLGYATTAEQLAVSRERNRLARDLHDTLAHTLSAVSIQLEGVNSAWDYSPADARTGLLKSLDTARSGLAETRRAVQALRASPLDDLGLVLALRNLAESTAKRSGATLSLTLIDELTLAPDLEQNIYRIAQEALTNIVNHAHASTIRVTLHRAADAVILVIQDDGVGFGTEEAAPDGHYGLQGMKERARLIGATLAVASAPGQGATIRLIIPGQFGGTYDG